MEQTGPQRWNKSLSMNEGSWKKAFTSLKKLCKDKKLREFQFKFIRRIVVTIAIVLNQTMIAYTVEKKTPLTTHLETVNFQLLSKLRSSNGLTKQTLPA